MLSTIDLLVDHAGNVDYGGAPYYACAIKSLVQRWREAFQNPALWFGFVQIASFQYKDLHLCNVHFPNTAQQCSSRAAGDLRLAQLSALSLEHVGMSTAVDTGDFASVHPPDKQTVSRRLANQALLQIFDQHVPGAEFPVYAGSSSSLIMSDRGETVITVTVKIRGQLTGKRVALTTAAPSVATQSSSGNKPGWTPRNICPTVQDVTGSLPTDCGYPVIYGTNNTALNATAAIGPDGSSILLTAKIPRGSSAGEFKATASSMGRASWPLTIFFSEHGLPVIPWFADFQTSNCYTPPGGWWQQRQKVLIKTDDESRPARSGRRSSSRQRQRGAVLFCSPQGPDQVPSGDYVDLAYLRKLQAQGFEVDWTSTLTDANATRIRRYNALVVFATSTSAMGLTDALVAQFVADGGGVLLLSQMYSLRNLSKAFGADLPAELMNESNATNIGQLSHMPYPLWYTNNVAATSPVSDGVKDLWFPSDPAYNGQMTQALLLPSPWITVARAMPTVLTGPVQHADGTWPFYPSPVQPFVRNRSVAEPALMGVREVGFGRVGLLTMYNQFLFGSGEKWLFNSEVLSAGVSGRPSDMGLLLKNTLAWLIAPSLLNSSSVLGGFQTTPDTLLYPNERPAFVAGLKKV
eukprot:COSAG05_NODE_1774_length_4111_cov_5.453444_3_plen_633_part_01